MSFDQKFEAEIINQKIWIKHNNEIWSYELSDLLSDGQKRKKSNLASPDLLTAQMPGKITKIFVKNGDSVKQGDPLLVMEAMKMEYTVKSDLNTTVENVFVQVGQQMTIGAKLIQLVKVN
jgi:biotin carboxyl carrier protein